VTDEFTLATAMVRMWLGNPLSLRLLRFVAAEDACGNRLSNAIDYYLDQKTDVCWRCRLAGKILRHTVTRGGKLFGVSEEAIREGLGVTVFRRGLISVLDGIARYGVTMPQIINAPFLVVWDFTHRCNLRCRHCYQNAQTALPGELTTDEAKSLIEDLSDAGVVAIAFSGGEPLMRKDFFEVARHAHDHEMFVALASNGTLISPEVADRLRDEACVDYVEISLDGKDAASHDAMRGISGAFDRTVGGIRNCVGAGIFTCVATTVTRSNYAQALDIYRLARDLAVRRFMWFNFIPTGRGTEMWKEDLTPEQREELMRALYLQNTGNGTEALSTAPQFARVAMQVERDGRTPVGHFYQGDELAGKGQMLAEFIGGCGAGRLYCSVEPTGDIQPCVFMPITVGNIRERPFLEIWHESPILQQLRDRGRLKGGCGDCAYKYVCGGCRARAWSYFRDLDAPDPGCINNREYWDGICKR